MNDVFAKKGDIVKYIGNRLFTFYGHNKNLEIGEVYTVTDKDIVSFPGSIVDNTLHVIHIQRYLINNKFWEPCSNFVLTQDTLRKRIELKYNLK